MNRIAMSTVAFPERTVEDTLDAAARLGFDGVVFRTFGTGGRELACDPMLTSGPKIVRLMRDRHLTPVCLATGIRYDARIFPPVIGRAIGDIERSIRETKRAIDAAAEMECPFVRVFGFEMPRGEKPGRATRRILERLDASADHARNRGVRLLVENGGSFSTARALADLLDRATFPQVVGASYSMATGMSAGDEPSEALRTLAPWLNSVTLKDFGGGRPCVLGAGTGRVEAAMRALVESNFDGWIVLEHDRLWFPDAPQSEGALRQSLEWLARWRGAGSRTKAPAGGM